MRTYTIQIINNDGLKAIKALKDKNHIRIVEESAYDSPSLPGAALNMKAFKSWIAQAEEAPTLDLKAVKGKWAARKKQLQKLTR